MKEAMQKNTFLSLSGTVENVLGFTTSLITRPFQDGDKSFSAQKSDVWFLLRVLYFCMSIQPLVGGRLKTRTHARLADICRHVHFRLLLMLTCTITIDIFT